jgi:superfamily II DNA or RNA helicase
MTTDNDNIKTIITFRGYGLVKDKFDKKELENLRKELKVSPKGLSSYNNLSVQSYIVYQESVKRLYIPKYLGLQRYGVPDKNKLKEGIDIDVKFNGKLRENQVKPVEAFLSAIKDETKQGGLINLPCGFGKCLAYDTSIIMYDGNIKKVQDIQIGDKLMGDDSTPREVLSLARGREMMYDIIPDKGDKYTVNESHILSLKSIIEDSDDYFEEDNIIDISLLNYLKLRNKDSFVGYRVPIDFPFKHIDIEPYNLGHSLTNTIIISKFIPTNYKFNNRNVRMELLAGIIDSNGFVVNNKYEIIMEYESLLDDIIYVARSLGFLSFKKSFQDMKSKIYYKTTIYGNDLDEIPVRDQSKKIYYVKYNKDILNVKIKIEKKKIDDYYGFTIDGNQRFLLGDFQVTHNTSISLYIITKLLKKTLVVVHKDFLLKQWRERIEQFIPEARIGTVKAKTIDIEDKDIVIGSLQSLSMKEYDKGTFDEFGFIVIDECFPYRTGIVTDKGVMYIGVLYNKWKNKEELPKILSYNKNTTNFEYKEMTYSWKKINKYLIEISMSKKKFKCTLNHKILTINGYIEANKLNIGDIIISKYDKLNIDNSIAPALNDEQLQIIYGSYLGNGHIEITKENRYRLKLIHYEEQKDYCKWKAEMFGIENNDYSQKSVYSFQTKIFDLEYNISKNTKEVPDWLLDKLDIKGISIWFMDYGSNQIKYNKNGTISNFISINTNNFNYEIQEKFVNKFKKYNIDCSIRKENNNYYINFNKENSDKLLNLIKPYIHPSFNYKIYSNIDLEELISKNKYKWNNNFLNYGTLKVTKIVYLENIKEKWQKEPYVYDIEVKDNHNFIIGTKITSKNQTEYIDGPVVSNCHHIGSEVFSRTLHKINCKYSLGLSATMTRKDGLTKVFKWHLGDIVFKAKNNNKDKVDVYCYEYDEDDIKYNKEEINYNGKCNMAKMINNICDYEPRTDFIVNIIEGIKKKEEKRNIILLSDRRNHLKILKDKIEGKNVGNVGYYVGGMKDEELKKSEDNCDILLGTFSMASEGMDIPKLDTIILASPKSDIVQSIGRVLRKKLEDRVYIPLVIDINDMFSMFLNQNKKRLTYYKKCKYNINHIKFK